MHVFSTIACPAGLRNPQVQMFYERAKSGIWPPDSDMLKNVGEFLAMTGSTYLCGHAARPAFSRANIEAKQPQYAQWLARNLR